VLIHGKIFLLLRRLNHRGRNTLDLFAFSNPNKNKKTRKNIKPNSLSRNNIKECPLYLFLRTPSSSPELLDSPVR